VSLFTLSTSRVDDFLLIIMPPCSYSPRVGLTTSRLPTDILSKAGWHPPFPFELKELFALPFFGSGGLLKNSISFRFPVPPWLCWPSSIQTSKACAASISSLTVSRTRIPIPSSSDDIWSNIDFQTLSWSHPRIGFL
jgi:hypothetical protein